MARINTSLGGQSDALLPADASQASAAARKRSRKAEARTKEDRPSKRARKTTEPEAQSRGSRRERGGEVASKQPQNDKKRGRSEQRPQANAKSSKSRREDAKKQTGRPGSPQRVSDENAEIDASLTDARARKPAGTATRSKPAAKLRKTTQDVETVGESSRSKSAPRQKPSQISDEGSPERTSDAEDEPEAREEEEVDSRLLHQSPGTSAGQVDAPFRRLVPCTRMVPMATMSSKWAPLEREAIAAVHALLEECARPVLSRTRAMGASSGSSASERRQEQTRQAISSVTRRLRSKLVKGIPFPPGTVVVTSRRRRRGANGQNDKVSKGLEADFNYESAAEGAQALEQQLTPLQHAIALLERERKCEEDALEDDYAALRELETNAQADLRTWRERARKAHRLVPVPLEGGVDGSSDISKKKLSELELVVQPPTANSNGDEEESEQQSGVLFENLDKDLSTTAIQLSSHMDSIRANLEQIDGVVPAIIQSKAALQHVLRERLDPLQYEGILLGQ
ncbi:hypothetical protein SEPCBS57363_004279 [Sporothrix epigloea]|uniref:Kinetochore protein fta7 n=1 Tax=Sporothrix epigloea TaxID=1892477 RepID=A0ABP0DV22_9PEZI